MKTKRFFSFGTVLILIVGLFASSMAGAINVARATDQPDDTINHSDLSTPHNNDNDDDDNDNGDGDGNNQPVGSIRVCVLALDANWDMLPESAVTNVTFTVPGMTAATVYSETTAVIPSTVVTSPFVKNTQLLAWSSENDAVCTTYENLDLGNYYYGEEIISGTNSGLWDTYVKYYDDEKENVDSFDDYAFYGHELFDADTTNDWGGIYTSDGHIPLYEAEPLATLVVVNALKPVITDGGNGDGGNGGGGNGGGGQGGGGDTSFSSGNGMSAGSIPVSTAVKGQVLGESTCGVYLTAYLRHGYLNNTAEVKKLQTFLNANLSLKLEVSGDFDLATETAVIAFQVKESASVLSPWKIGKATGVVYLTTRNHINNIMCETLKSPTPTSLINWNKNPETAIVAKLYKEGK